MREKKEDVQNTCSTNTGNNKRVEEGKDTINHRIMHIHLRDVDDDDQDMFLMISELPQFDYKSILPL